MNLFFNLIIFIKLILFINHVHSDESYDTCQCGETGFFTKIVGGREAKKNFYPWAVALVGYPSDLDEDNFFCAGTIVSSRFIVTAGHCFETNEPGYDFSRMRLKIGAHNLSDHDYIKIKPKSVKIYEGYSEDNDIYAPVLDIALLELEEDLPVNNKIRPICIHSKNFNYLINDLKERRELSLKKSNKGNNENSKINLIKKKKNIFKKFDQPRDDHKIILRHPDKELIRQVVKTVEIYYQEIRNDPVKIFDPSKEFTHDNITVIGWGTTDPYENIMPDVLMETEIDQHQNEECENSYGDDVFFRSKMICAVADERDSCRGDSGGGIMIKKKGVMNLYGVVSHGRVCGSVSSPGVYTRVSAFLEWILLHTIDSKFCAN